MPCRACCRRRCLRLLPMLPRHEPPLRHNDAARFARRTAPARRRPPLTAACSLSFTRATRSPHVPHCCFARCCCAPARCLAALPALCILRKRSRAAAAACRAAASSAAHMLLAAALFATTTYLLYYCYLPASLPPYRCLTRHRICCLTLSASPWLYAYPAPACHAAVRCCRGGLRYCRALLLLPGGAAPLACGA